MFSNLDARDGAQKSTRPFEPALSSGWRELVTWCGDRWFKAQYLEFADHPTRRKKIAAFWGQLHRLSR
jgi:hypothetical protein